MKIPTGFLPNSKVFAGVLILLLFVTTRPVWADECQEARSALAIAEADLAVAQQAQNQAQARADQASNDADRAYERAVAARVAYLKAIVAKELAYSEALTNTATNFDWLFNTEANQAYEAAQAAYQQAVANMNAAREAFEAAQAANEAAIAAASQARADLRDARANTRTKEAAVRDAQRRVEEACGGESELERLLEGFGMNDGAQVRQEYATRAQNANTEDIAIDAESRGGVHGGGGGSTNVSGTVNCFGSPGQATVAFNGSQVCSSTGGLASTGNTFNSTCTSGQTVNFSIACPGATPGPTCHMFLVSLSGATCSAGVVGGQTNGPATVNCTCN